MTLSSLQSDDKSDFEFRPFKVVKPRITARVVMSMAFLLLSCHAPANAEGNCPPGYYPIGAPPTLGCAPIPNNGQRPNATRSTAYWADRYGAIAIGSPMVTIAGSSKGFKSRKAAEKAAISDCAPRGATGCKVITSFGNACAAYAVGFDRYAFMTGATRDEASDKTEAQCERGTKNCQVYFTICSEAELID